MVNLLQRGDEKGFAVLPLLCGIAVIGWLSGCVYLLGNNEIRLVNYIKTKIEIESFCEQSLMKTSKLIKNKELSFDKIEKVGNEPVYTGNDNGISCNVYAVKENDNIVLLGAGRKEDAIVRIYLHLSWQEDSKTWIPLYYES